MLCVSAQLLSDLDPLQKDSGWQASRSTLEQLALRLECDAGVRLSVNYARALLRWHGCLDRQRPVSGQ